MKVELTSDADGFAERARPVLEADPFSTAILAGALHRTLRRGSPSADDAVWITVTDTGGTVVGAAMHTPPHSPFLPRQPAGAAAAIARALLAAGRHHAGVVGEQAAAHEYAAEFTALTGQACTVAMAMRLHRLATLTAPSGVPGSARPAEAADIPLVADWLTAFAAEAIPDDPPRNLHEMADRRVTGREVWLWEADGVPVSMAAAEAPGTGVAKIAPVYTPPQHRCRGYGAAVTAAATRHHLDSGAAHVVLYTDLANPTSNSIYAKIGYRPHHDALHLRFGANTL